MKDDVSPANEKIVQEQIVGKVILTREQDFMWKLVCWGFYPFGNLILQTRVL